ncbi:hypothetical protein MRBBS_2989 [Marinobacter sp. BSs20148]|nr:hypothetical protein MRBBS_2989 [Marinobacter sp. BSs20148]
MQAEIITTKGQNSGKTQDLTPAPFAIGELEFSGCARRNTSKLTFRRLQWQP